MLLTDANDVELEATLQELTLNLGCDAVKTDMALGEDGGGSGHLDGEFGFRGGQEGSEKVVSCCCQWCNNAGVRLPVSRRRIQKDSFNID